MMQEQDDPSQNKGHKLIDSQVKFLKMVVIVVGSVDLVVCSHQHLVWSAVVETDRPWC